MTSATNFEELKQKLLYLKKDELTLIKRAYDFASLAHEGGNRASGEPFINHCLAVASTLADLKLDGATIAAALLHDTIEDTPVNEKSILNEFGEEIMFLVFSLTKLEEFSYKGQEREIENLRKMFLAMAKDIRVVIIKLADRLHNMKTISFLPEENQLRIAKETMEIYAPLANRLGIGQIKGELEDLSFPHLYPEEYKAFLHNVSGVYEAKKEYAKKLKPIITEKLTKEKIKVLEIQTRVKHLWSLFQKMKKYEGDISKIYDLVALRIIVPSIEDCYAAMGAIHKNYHPLPGRIKDYLSLPKPTGYRSLHTTVFCEEGEITELQIRTKEMHEEAEHGNTLAAFRLGQLYSRGSWGAPQDIEASIKWFGISAKGGFWSAQVKLGFIYEFGRGTERDLKQAVYWYEQAAEQGMYPDLDDKILHLQEKLRSNDSE